jgi:iron complex transport system ATP-binding protein
MPAFGVIDDETHAQHLALVKSSHCAILCNMPIGLNNQRNLEALSAARWLVSIEDVPFAQRDFTGGSARNLFDTIRPTIRCRSPEEAVTAVWEVLARDPDNRVPLAMASTIPAVIEDLREGD